MTQKVFSDVLGVSVWTVEAWEAGKSHPNGSARRLLQLIDQKPNLIEEIKECQLKDDKECLGNRYTSLEAAKQECSEVQLGPV